MPGVDRINVDTEHQARRIPIEAIVSGCMCRAVPARVGAHTDCARRRDRLCRMPCRRGRGCLRRAQIRYRYRIHVGLTTVRIPPADGRGSGRGQPEFAEPIRMFREPGLLLPRRRHDQACLHRHARVGLLDRHQQFSAGLAGLRGPHLGKVAQQGLPHREFAARADVADDDGGARRFARGEEMTSGSVLEQDVDEDRRCPSVRRVDPRDLTGDPATKVVRQQVLVWRSPDRAACRSRFVGSGVTSKSPRRFSSRSRIAGFQSRT